MATSNGGLGGLLNPPGILTALMRAFGISKARSETIVKSWWPQRPLWLAYMQSHTIRNYPGLHFAIPPNTRAGTASEFIDVSNDLIIIVCPLPASTTWMTYPSVESIGALFECDPSSNLSLSFPGFAPAAAPAAARFPLGYQAEFLQPFPRLRVLYIIVKPEDIEQVVNPQQSTMTEYHRDYTQTVHQFPPKTFNARQRIYYEMPEMRCRGLDWIYKWTKQTTGEVRAKNPELDPLVIRVMTWKYAPGVRGRFDLD